MKSAPISPTCYARVSPREQPPRNGFYRGGISLAVNPILGAGFVFPRYFAGAVEKLLRDPQAVDLPPARARWYFGSALQVEVDPARLQRRISDYVRDDRGLRWVGTSFLDAAEWNAALAPIANSPIHREMTALVEAGLDYRAIRSYRAFFRAIRRRRPVSRNGIRLAGPEEIEAYFRYCVGLIESMREHGIVPRREFGRLGSVRVDHRGARPPALDTAERDIGIAINADGELIRHLGGKHRTAIAQVLRLPKIPVEVRLVHVRWLASEMRRTGLPAHEALRSGVARLQDEPPAATAASVDEAVLVR